MIGSNSKQQHQADKQSNGQCSTPTNSLKSSVKRLFSPKHTHHPLLGSSAVASSTSSSSQILTAPSGSTVAANTRSKDSSNQKRTAPVIAGSMQTVNLVTTQNVSNGSQRLLTTIKSQHEQNNPLSSSSTSSTTSSDRNGTNQHAAASVYDEILPITTMEDASLVENTISTCSNVSSASNHQSKGNKKQTAASQELLPQPRATSTLKKGFNLLKSNSKKVLMGGGGSSHFQEASSSNGLLAQSPSKPSVITKTSGKLASPASSSSITESLTSSQPSLNQINAKFFENEQRINELSAELSKSQRVQIRCNDLQSEIERMSRLYDYEIGNRNKYEEKLASLKQMAEEKQIESAAIKFEFRKMQDLREAVIAENQYLKSMMANGNGNVSRSGTPQASSNYIQNGNSAAGESTPSPSSKGTLRLKQLNGGSSSPSINAQNTPNSKNNSLVHLLGGHKSENANLNNENGNQQQYQFQQQQLRQQQGYQFNRSMSPATSNALSPQQSQQLSAMQQQPQLNSNSKQQIMQQQNTANATAQAAAAAADYYEQQFKAQQNKNIELEQQLRMTLEQVKELKETVDSLNEMNRKFYDENQQFKERSMDQRQQIDNFHALFQDNKQEHEQSMNALRTELDESYQRENELKRRLQQAFEAKQHESYQMVSQLKEKLDETKLNEANLNAELQKCRQLLEIERNRAELVEKKLKVAEKELNSLHEKQNLERVDKESKAKSLEEKCELVKKQATNDRLKLEEKFRVEKDDYRKQMNDLERKIEEVIKEKAQMTCKYGQLVESNRELNSIIMNNQVYTDKKVEETKNKLEFYISKCNDLEKEIAESQENHVRDTEEWKKFQADLQTAVRVANDFMMEAEEKVNKMKEDYLRAKEKEQSYVDEIEKLKRKVSSLETSNNKNNINSSNSIYKSNKENLEFQTPTPSQSQSSVNNPLAMRNLVDSIESTLSNSSLSSSSQLPTTTAAEVVASSASSLVAALTPLQQLSQHSNNSHSSKLTTNSYKYSSSSSASILNGNHHNNHNHHLHQNALNLQQQQQQSTDTDDAKMISSRVRSNSSSNETQTITSSMRTYNALYSTLPKPQATTASSALSSAAVSSAASVNNADALANLVKTYGVSKRNALMKWCQERIGDYKGVEIKNFSSSWNDGLAFCALLHSFMPHKIEYEQLRKENNPRKNFLTAFNLAQGLGIEQTLNISDLLNHERPDWNAVMNYVTLIYKHFHQQLQHQTSQQFSDEEKVSASSASSGGGCSSSTNSSSSSSPVRTSSTASSILH